MNTLFPTQEIGSLAKPSWLLKAYRQNIGEKELAEVREWGNMLGIEDIDGLKSLLGKNDLKSRKEELRDWASIFGIKYCETAGLDIVYDGEVRRVEMYEYPIRRINGFEFYGRVRSFDNKYYRKAACVDKVGFKKAYHLDEFRFVKSNASKWIKVPITGPYTLGDWSFNEHYLRNAKSKRFKDRRREANRLFVLDLAKEVIRPNIKALVSEGADYVQIDEPAATTHPDEVAYFVEAFNEATAGIDCKFAVHICFSDYRALYPQVLEMKNCSQFSWEFANRDDDKRSGYKDLGLFKEYGDDREIGLGVIDVHSDTIESPELVKERILHAANYLGDPGRLYINPDCGLRTRTWSVAYEKLKNMVKGTVLARAELE